MTHFGGHQVDAPSPASGAGRFNPYRGMDVHGVASPDVWQDVAAPRADNAEVPVHIEPPEQEAVPVRIVSEAGRERRLFRTYVEYVKPTVDAPPRMIVGLNEHRTKVTVFNTDAANGVLLSDAPNALPLAGIPVPGSAAGNVKEEFTSETPVYACAAGNVTGTVVRLVIKEEYAVEE